MLRLVLPTEQVDGVFAAGPAPTWKGKASSAASSSTGPVTNAASFINAANQLPNWKYLAVNFAGQSIRLQRPNTGDTK